MAATWTLSWRVADGNFADAFNVYLRAEGGVWQTYATTTGFTVEIEVPDLLEPYEVAVVPVLDGIEAPESTWEVQRFTPGSLDDIPVPPDVVDFSVEQIDESFDVRARIGAVDDPFLEGYEIREGDWETGLVRAFVPVSATRGAFAEATFGIMATGDTSFHVRPRSIHGQYSNAPTSITKTLVAHNQYVAETPTDEAAGGFAGTKTGVEVESGGLQVTKAPAVMDDWTDVMDSYTWPWGFPHQSTGSYVTEVMEAQDDATAGIVADEVVEIALAGQKVDPSTMVMDEWSFTILPQFVDGDETQAADPGAKGVYHYVNMDETIRDGLEMKIEIDTTPDDPSGSPTWDGFRLWVPGARYRYRGVRFRFTLTMRWWWTWRITAMTFTRKRKNLKDERTVVDGSGSGPATVTFSVPFTKAPKVVATVDGSTAAMATVENITRTGCDLYLWNASGSQITGTAYVVAAGV